ncbi:serine protease inhibitor 77Ba-like [Vanessa atalanta]|uniref:serine protease inhibitor 77Ba-like n=1 Tax=Vanessa atalanta TaxID=42275 RepID=UPI001FCD7A6C|nr:serine protease inhibitor 77Ba-like [Vanessa atalanta]
MSRLIFILICGLIPSLLAQCTVKKTEPLFKRSVFEFSVNLLTRIAQEKENHFVTSTLSTWTLLTCTSLGASETTLSELKQVLQLENNKCFNNKYLKLANRVTSNNNTDVVFERSASIYVDSKLEIRNKFRKRISESGVSQIETISFEDSDKATQIINDFASRATHDTIDEVVSPGDLDDVLMVMIDAVYFKGSWQTPFVYEETEVSPFYNERDVQIGTVNLMYQIGSFNIRTIQKINANVLELPYGKNNRYSMLIFLPEENVSLYSVIEKLKLISLSTISKLFDEMGPQMVSVQIPRFKITSDLSNLKELLVDMGLKTMFDSSQAQFPIISKYPLYVANFIQKADIEVTEEGTVASAVTKAEFAFRTFPAQFVANRPFFFMIVDKKSEVPIFTGAYSKPSLF